MAEVKMMPLNTPKPTGDAKTAMKKAMTGFAPAKKAEVKFSAAKEK